MTDIVLIKANNQKKLYQNLSDEDLTGIEPPLWIALTAAVLRDKGFSVQVIDAEAENLDPKEAVAKAVTYNPVLAGVVVSGTNPSASTINMPGASEMLTEFKRIAPHVPTILSGLHPSTLSEKTITEEDCDFIATGEGFLTYEELVKALKNGQSKDDDFAINGLWYVKDGKTVSNPRSANVADLSTLPMPAWDLLPMDKYRAHNWHCFGHVDQRQPYAVIYTSLGCPFTCSFCCINSIFGGPGIRYRPPAQVVAEIDHLVKTYGVKNIKVLDEMFALKPTHVEELCDGIIALGHDLNFWVYGRIDTVKKHMLPKMKQAGMNWIAYGIEAGSKKVRDGVSKGRFSQEKIYEVVQMTHDAGIEIVANFIFGLPDDDFETMQETLDMAKELNCAYANLYCAMAYPGSELYRDAIQQNLPLPEHWDGYAQFSKNTFPLPTKHLSGGEVLSFRDRAFDEYNNSTQYLNMIEKKFGIKTVEHIKRMCAVKLERNFADPLPAGV